MNGTIEMALQEASDTLNAFYKDRKNINLIQSSISAIVGSFQNGGKILSCGNGGSMCDAMHFAEELTGRFRGERPALPAIAISDPSHLTCVANDYGLEHVFSRSIEALGKKEDILLAISTSGNSPNIIKAVEAAKKLDMQVIALLGRDGGQIKSKADFPLIVQAQNSDRIQEVHIKIIHIFIEGVERSLFPKNY